MKALFIGRFQPFHKGHLEVVKNLSKKYKKVIIGMGSSQYKNKSDNPFSSNERKLMIKNSLDEYGIKNYKIIEIPDIHDPPNWVDHVLSITTDFDIVITNNSFTKKLFLEKGFNVEETPLYNKQEYSGKEIRNRIENNQSWENLVPEPVARAIKRFGGPLRIRKLNS
jgi:nicotinamide-nucleotide adenylyltransferase